MGVGGKRRGWGVENFFPHPNELLIRAYPENLVKIGLLVEAVDTFCGTGRARDGDGDRDGRHNDYKGNLSFSFGSRPGLWLELG